MDLSSILSLPIGLMTGAQFLTLMAEAYRNRQENESESIPVTNTEDDSRYAYGIPGICEIFGCSKPTAQRIKRSGVIKDAITQYGRTIVIDRQKALELAREADNKRKGGRRCKK